MRIGVLGAGAVGGTLAALLERAGHEVDVTARGPHLRAIQDGGLRLAGGYGDHVARVAAAERLGRPPELAIVATKIADARDAMTENAGWLRGIPVLVVQPGLSAITMGVECLPRSQVVGGLALAATSLTEPGLVTVTSPAGMQIGSADGPGGAGVALVREVLDPVMPITVAPDFRAPSGPSSSSTGSTPCRPSPASACRPSSPSPCSGASSRAPCRRPSARASRAG